MMTRREIAPRRGRATARSYGLVRALSCRVIAAELGEIDLADFDDRAGPAQYVELAQDVGDVNLDRGFADVELIGDLLVLQAAAEHVENAQLLRRQIVKPLQELPVLALELRVAGRIAIGAREAHRAAQDVHDGAGDLAFRGGFRDIAGDPEGQDAGDDLRLLVDRNHDDGVFGESLADSDQAQGARRARHRQVEQDEVDGRRRRQDSNRLVDRGGLQYLGIRCCVAYGAPE